MGKYVTKLDLLIFLLLILVSIFFGFRGDQIIDRDLNKSFFERNKAATIKLKSYFPGSEISYLRSYYENPGSEVIVSEYLVSDEKSEISRIRLLWKDGYLCEMLSDWKNEGK